MNIKRLKQLIANAPDDALVLVPTCDHSYRVADIVLGTALRDKHEWTEDFGEESTPEAEYGKRHPALIVT